MASRVYLHIGLPKTGTTYLQTILWHNHEELRRQGLLVPGRSSRQHLWASGVVREDPNLARRHEEAPESWSQLVAEVGAWPGVAVISHEFFAAASGEQALRAVAQLAPAEVHVVVTARDTLGLVTARWQELVKNGATTHIDGYPATESTDPANEWDWGTMDVADVLDRWGAGMPAERIHILTLPKASEPKETLWLRFAGLLGVDASRCDHSASQQNESLGVVEVELLRRINGDLEGFSSPVNRGVWIRGYLAQGKLVPRRGEKFWPSPERVKELRARGDEAVAAIRSRGYDVIGDLDDLLTPDNLPERRHPDSVTDAEMLSVATATIAEMLKDVRRLSNQERRAAAAAAGSSAPPSPSRARGHLRRRVGRMLQR
jgi:hypothetical protein